MFGPLHLHLVQLEGTRDITNEVFVPYRVVLNLTLGDQQMAAIDARFDKQDEEPYIQADIFFKPYIIKLLIQQEDADTATQTDDGDILRTTTVAIDIFGPATCDTRIQLQTDKLLSTP